MKGHNEGLLGEKTSFEGYAESIGDEFEAYSRLVDEEYGKYRDELAALWPVVEVSDRKKWLEYWPDYRTKRLVDFEKGFISIDIIQDKGEDAMSGLQVVLEDMLLEDRKTAFDRDRVASSVERRLKDASKSLRSAEVKAEPILSPLILGKKSAPEDEVKKKASAMIREGKVERTPSSMKGLEIVSIKMPLPSKSIMQQARFYQPVVRRYSESYGVESALVLSVIHTESAFNPMATSYVPAYGLMQIVPRSAGMDATRFLYGSPSLLSPSYLYNYENNIKIGVAYLHMLSSKYFKEIKDPQSRLYCAISAYNTGPGNVARAFTGKMDIALAVLAVNKMDPAEVYRSLKKGLPYAETRDYLDRVSGRIAAYRDL